MKKIPYIIIAVWLLFMQGLNAQVDSVITRTGELGSLGDVFEFVDEAGKIVSYPRLTDAGEILYYLPLVTNDSVPASLIGSNSATAYANIVFNGWHETVTGQGFQLSTNAAFSGNVQTFQVTPDNAYADCVAPCNHNVFSYTFTGLSPGTTYYVRAYATNASGTSYSNVLIFSTLSCLPTVTATVNPSNVASTSAIVLSEVVTDCGSSVTSRGVCWGTASGPTLSGSHTSDGSGAGSFTSSLTGLSPNTTYYVRAYATNGLGTAYGNEVTFTTPCWIVDVSISGLTSFCAGESTTLTATGATNYTWNNGTSGSSITVSEGGTYTVTGWDQYACSGSASKTVTVHMPQHGSVTVSDCGSYTWHGTVYTQSGVYTYPHTDNYGCQQVDTLHLTLTPCAGVPTVTISGGVENVTTTTATVVGNVTSDGGAAVTARGIQVSTSAYFNNYTTHTSGSGTGSYTVDLTGLTPYTTYYVRAYATNAVGTSYSQTISFTTAGYAPTLAACTVTDITTVGATFNGNVTSDNLIAVTSRGFQVSTSSYFNGYFTYTSGQGTGAFSATATDLTPHTTYYVRAYATNAVGTNYSAIVSFTTAGNVPTLSACTVTDITTSGATVGATVTSDNGLPVTVRGIQISTNAYFNNYNTHSSGSGTGSYAVHLTDLSPYTTYYVRAYATNAVGTGYGEASVFMTAGNPPTLGNSTVTDITTTSATVNGNVASDNQVPVTARGVRWSVNFNMSSSSYDYSGAGIGDFSINLTNLAPYTTYYYQTFATNAVGTTYSEKYSFTTAGNAPTLGNSSVTDITTTSATVNGNVASDNQVPVTSRGVRWSVNFNMSSSSYDYSGTGIGDFSINLTNLAPYTTYYYQTFATNAVGTTYSEKQSFTTAGNVPTLGNSTVTDITTTSATVNGNVVSDNQVPVTSRGVRWSVNFNMSSSSYDYSGTGIGDFSINLTNLAPYTTYYYQTFATNAVGTAYGEKQSFTTAGNVPTLGNSTVTDITTTSATVHGNVASDNQVPVTSRGVRWSVNFNMSSSSYDYSGTGIGDFSINLTNLAPYTTYYYQTFATNAVGTAYGEKQSFTTKQIPTVTTLPASNITTTTAMLHGEISNPDNSTITSQGFEWKTTANGSYTQVEAAGTAMSYSLTGLTPNTSYTYRAFMTTANGTSYGSALTFNTSCNVVNVTISGSTDICNGETAELTATGAANYTWNNGTTGSTIAVGASGTYTVTGWDEFNCSGSASKTVTVHTPQHRSNVESACSSYTWHRVNNTDSVITTSGTYIFHYQDSYGCGLSTDTLYLTIYQPTSGSESVSTCNSYSWHGSTYTTSGNFVWHTTNVAGCDSAVTLHLTINNGTFTTINDNVCNTYTWHRPDNTDTVITTSGTYIFGYENANGCASSVTLHIEISTCEPYDAQPCPNAPTVTDVEGNVYNTVMIGTQCWMAENLRTKHFRDGHGISTSSTSSTSDPYYYQPTTSQVSGYSISTYGLYYNWPAVVSSKGLCPAGWHIPTNAEWITMTSYVSSKAPYRCSESSSYIAKALASESGWSSSCTSSCNVGCNALANNRTGFSAYPAGNSYYGTVYNSSTGNYTYQITYSNRSYSAIYWTGTSVNSGTAYSRTLNYSSDELQSSSSNKDYGYSVRCVLGADSYGEGYGENTNPVPDGDAQPCPNAPTVTDVEGNVYNTVKIGNQCWMAENLRTKHFRDGHGLSTSSTSSTSDPYYYQPTTSQVSGYNISTYGLYYNWPAVVSSKGLCPAGWHIPTDAEWTQLSNYVRGVPAYVCGGNTSYIAKSLALGTGWSSTCTNYCGAGCSMSANNRTGFSAYPAGNSYYGTVYNSSTGNYTYQITYSNRSYSAIYWTGTSVNSGTAYSRTLNYSSDELQSSSSNKDYGYSVRCVLGADSYGEGYGENTNPVPDGDAQPCPGTPTVTDVEGNVYNTVKIGNQCWMAENLRTKHFRDGYGLSTSSTSSTSDPYYYQPTTSQVSGYNISTYGLYYNWPAVVSSKGLCPAGWHIPTDAEWTQLSNYVRSVPAYVCGGNTSYIAKSLASGTGWSSTCTNYCGAGCSMSANNRTGFSAYPAGNSYYGTVYNSSTGNYTYQITYSNRSYSAIYWTATSANSSNGYTWTLNYNSDELQSTTNAKNYGYSVRCLRDINANSTATTPTVITYPVTDATTTASINSEVTSNGGSTVTARGICWGTSHNPNMLGSYTTDGSGNGAYTSVLTGLVPNTTYYVRPYATNAMGIAFGEEVSFVAGCGTLSVNITGNTNVCANQSTTLTATGGTSYRWSTGSTYASITVYPATSQTYTVTAYDTYGCSTSKTADINVLPLPDVQISGSTDICQGESTTLTATGANTYHWNTGSYNQSISVMPSTTTTYWVTGTDANGCSTTVSRVVNVGVFPSDLVIHVGNDLCYGDSLAVNVTPVLNDVQYVWNYPNIPVNTYAFYYKPLQNVEQDYVDTLSLTVVNAQGCQSEKEALITVYSLPQDEISGPSSICQGDTVHLHATGQHAYTWYQPIDISQMHNDTVWHVPAVDQTYTLEVGNAHGCHTFLTKVVAVNECSAVTSPNPCTAPATHEAQTGSAYQNNGYNGANHGLETVTADGKINSVTDYDGNEYPVVQIGSQCWFAQNLRVVRYSDGTPITNGGGSYSIVTGYLYNYSSSGIDFELRGYLYNYPAAIKEICPVGWHVPTDMEWDVLTNYVSSQSEYWCGNNSNAIAKAMSVTSGWDNYTLYNCAVGYGQGTNTTGFSAVPAGYLLHGSSSTSSCRDAGRYAKFWSSTNYDNSYAKTRYLYFTDANVMSSTQLKYDGLSVRCLRDETGNTAQVQPTAITSPATNLTSTSATLSGTVSNPDNVTVTAQGFEWKATAGGTYTAVNATGDTMSYSLTGLTANTGYTYRAFVTTASGTSYGEEVTFTTVQESEFNCGTTTVNDHEGNSYNTVQIGPQCWTKENMRCSTSPKGYLTAAGNGEYSNYVAYYYNYSASSVPFEERGYLYNWAGALDTTATGNIEASFTNRRGICPEGWHIPSDLEWQTLILYLTSQEQYRCGNDNGNIAKALASKYYWNSSTYSCHVGYLPEENNSSGFSAVPAGCMENTSFGYDAVDADFHTSTSVSGSNLYRYSILSSSTKVDRISTYKSHGRSVRCIRNGDDGLTTVNMGVTGNSTLTTCEAFICDDGGVLGNNSYNCNSTLVVYPAVEGQGLMIDGATDMSTYGNTHLYFYEGEGTDGALLADYAGGSQNVEVVSATPITIQFVSTYSAAGFVLHVSCVTCLPPSNITATDIEADAISLSWDGSADLYDVYMTGADTGHYTTTDNSIVISGLSHSSTYNFQIKSHCGTDSSFLSSVRTFITPCGAITVTADHPWMENFEGYTGSGEQSFICWDRPIVDASYNSPFVYCGYAGSCHSGNNSAELKGASNMLVLPSFSNDIHDLRLSFWATSLYPSYGSLEIGVVDNALDPGSFELVGTTQQPSSRGNNPPENGNFIGYFDFSDVSAIQGRIALRYTSTFATNSWNLDDFVVEMIPTTPAVTSPKPCTVPSTHPAQTGSTYQNNGFSSANHGLETLDSDDKIISVTDYDGNEYPVVQIGSQCWLAENMRCTHSPSTGTYIVNHTTSLYTYTGKMAKWYTGAVTLNGNSVTLDSAACLAHNFGLLYNWNAAVDVYNTTYGELSIDLWSAGNAVNIAFTGDHQGICPRGWHVPTDAEWSTMELVVNGSDVSSSTGYRGTHAGKLAGGDDWNTYPNTTGVPGNYTDANRNSSGFSAVPAGGCIGSSFDYAGNTALFWSSSQDEGNTYNAWSRGLYYSNAGVGRDYNRKYYGFSVRCLRDEIGNTAVAPTATTSPATNLTSTSATLHGTITNPDNVTVTAQGFEWKASTGSTYTVVNATGDTMSYSLTGLTANTGYTYRAFVTTASGTSYGEEVTFTTAEAVVYECTPYPCSAPPASQIDVVVHQFDSTLYNTSSILYDNNDVPYIFTYKGDTLDIHCGWLYKFNVEAGSIYEWNTDISQGVVTPYGNNGIKTKITLFYDDFETPAIVSQSPVNTNIPTYAAGLAWKANYTGTVGVMVTRGDGDLDPDGSYCACNGDDLLLRYDKLANSPTDYYFIWGRYGTSDTIPCDDNIHYVYDSGLGSLSNNATGDYANNENGYLVLHPETSTSKLKFWGDSKLKDGDTLFIYNGDLSQNINLTPVDTIVGQQQLGSEDNPTFVSQTAGAPITLRMQTDESCTWDGLALYLKCYQEEIGVTSTYPCTPPAAHPAQTSSTYQNNGFNGANHGLETLDSDDKIISVTDYDGNEYPVVQIGSQCWLAENMRCTHSPLTGTYIVDHNTPSSSNYTYTGKQARWYTGTATLNGNSVTMDSAACVAHRFGLLYNWNAAVDVYNTSYGELSINTSSSNAVNTTFTGDRQGICPRGWHLPSDAEWNTLEATVSGSDWQSSYETSTSYRGTHAGKLTAGDNWTNSTTAGTPGDYTNANRNSSGFSAVPAGFCNGSSFTYAGSSAYFWSSSQNEGTTNDAWRRHLNYGYAGVGRNRNYKNRGFSVRCLRDESVATNTIKVTRIEGQGNGGLFLDMTDESREMVLANNVYNNVQYKGSHSPICVEVIDSTMLKPYDYIVKFLPNNEGDDVNDSTRWQLVIADNISDRTLIDNGVYTIVGGDTVPTRVVTSLYPISMPNEQIFPQLGISISIRNANFKIYQQNLDDYVRNKNGYTYANISQFAQPDALGSDITFSNDVPWLTGLVDQEGNYPSNWIRAGQQAATSKWECNSVQPDQAGCDYMKWRTEDFFNLFLIANANGYQEKARGFMDPNQQFENLVDGTWAPYVMSSPYDGGPKANYLVKDIVSGAAAPQPMYCDFTTLAAIPNKASYNQTLTNLYSVDIVLTPDKNLWTRAIVLEAGSADVGGNNQVIQHFNGQTYQNVRHEPKNCPSVDKYGNPDNSGTTGLGWFPGYAINVETGERLNIMFAENSEDEYNHGNDMIFNPTNVYAFSKDFSADTLLLDANGNPIPLSISEYNALRDTYGLAAGEPLNGGRHYVYVVGSSGNTSNLYYSTLSRRRNFNDGGMTVSVTGYTHGGTFTDANGLNHAYYDCGPYDQSVWLKAKFATLTETNYNANSRKAKKMQIFNNVMWTGIPMPTQMYEDQWLSSTATIKLRVSRPYMRYSSRWYDDPSQSADASQNSGYPMYVFSTKSSVTVTTSAATDVMQTNATLNAIIQNSDNVDITEMGFEWKIAANGSYANLTGTGAGNIFSANLSGLTAGTEYIYRAYVKYGATTVYGGEVSFTTESVGTPEHTVTSSIPCTAPATHEAQTGSTYQNNGYNGANHGLETVTTDGKINSVTDYDGNEYPVVQIGSQCWLAENMRCTHSPLTGTYIVDHNTPSSSNYTYTGKQARWYTGTATLNGNSVTMDSAACVAHRFGLLYNWNAAVDVYNNSFGEKSISANTEYAVNVVFDGNRQGICPKGWHVPTDADWTTLTDYMSSQSEYQCGGNSLNIGKALVSEIGWNSYGGQCVPGDQSQHLNNTSGFGVLPIGMYGSGFYQYGNGAFLWSSTQYENITNFLHVAYGRNPYYNNTGFPRVGANKANGCSVRCLRDRVGIGGVVQAPTVITDTASSISQTIATLHALVSNPDNLLITAKGFEWKATTGSTYTQLAGTGTGNSFTADLSELTAGTEYTYRAYVTCNGNNVYGDEKFFTTEEILILDGQPCINAVTMKDIDNNVYNTVQIGSQCWMAENLRTTRYADGTNIPVGSSGSETVAYRYYPNNSSSNVSSYGYLYNRKAVMRNSLSSNLNPSGVQGVCPNGWHVPSYAEWEQLTDYVISQSQYKCGSSTAIAKALASTSGWSTSTNSCVIGNNQTTNNATGFGAKPAGGYSSFNYNVGESANFWSTTEDGCNMKHFRQLKYDYAYVSPISTSETTTGLSVRCIRDATGDVPPAVMTGNVKSITSNSAVVTSEVLVNGGSAATSRGVCWSTTESPTLSGNHSSNGTGTGVYNVTITGLSSNTIYYVCAYATNNAGTTYGEIYKFTTRNDNALVDGQPCTGAPTVTDRDNNTYNTVQVGSQCWMAQNLRTTKYANGTSIPLGSTASTTTAYRYYPNNSSTNVTNYGYLYNWKAVMGNSSSSTTNPSGVQGICPNGWHVPSNAEWNQLSTYLNGAYNKYTGQAIASKQGWKFSPYVHAVGNNLNFNNSTGFGAMPSGYWMSSGAYGFGTQAGLWTATQSSYNANAAWMYGVVWDGKGVPSSSHNKEYANAVRCVRN